MDLRILGPVAAIHRGAPVPLGGPRQRAVLALLLLRANTVVSTDRLLDDLYGEEPPAAARKSLQAFVANLRRELNRGGEILIGRRPGYIVEVDTRVVDSLHFEDLLGRARRLVGDDPTAARALLTEALALWRGPPLADVAAESPVLEFEALRLDDARLDAIELRIDADLAVGERAALVTELEGLTAEHPLRERFWAQLMLALYGSGRQADALRTFRRARATLGEELGIEPAPELTQLEQKILLQDPSLGPILSEPGETVPAVVPEPGRTLHGYEIRSLVAHTRNGTVYRAYQPTLGREVAITSIIGDVADDPRFVRRFETDARRLAGLDHRGVAPLLDAWRQPGAAYLVTRWYETGTLADALTAGPIDGGDAAATLGEVGSALAAVHRAGLAHGRLGADDVLLAEGTAIVTGFTVTVDDPDPAADVAALASLVTSMLTGGSDQAALGDDLRSAIAGAPRHDVSGFVAAVVPALVSGGPEAEAAATNPYQGLLPFEESDRDVFFGREQLTGRLVSRLAEHRFLALVGASGSGKSSVIRAGLLPALRAGEIPGSDRWYVASMVPGADPFEELEAALTGVATAPMGRLTDDLRADPDALAAVVRAVVPSGGELVLVIDQFEELYTLVTDPTDRTAFLDSLISAVEAAPIRIVIGLRADFYDRPLSHAGIGEAVGRATESVVPLTAAELERAIAGPARHAGLTLETGLQARIVSDVAGQPGGLPLLQHALSELFERRTGTMLTHAAYEEIGGVQGALGRRAEATFAGLSGSQRSAARRMLLRLVAVTDEGGVTRRRVFRSELMSLGGPRSAAAAVLAAFGSHRLFSFDHDPATRSPTVELAHEALTRAWPRLRDWIDAGRADLALQRRLAAAVAEWRANDRDPAYLLTGARLAQFEEWARTGSAHPTALEAEYLREAVARRRSEAAAEQERAAREAALERRSRFRLRILVWVMAVAVVAVGALALVAMRRTDEAQRNLAIAQAQRLTAQASDAVDLDPELGILLALEAAERAASVGEEILPETIEALHVALPATRIVGTIPAGAVDFSPDGTHLVGAEPGTSLSGGPGQGTVTVFAAATGAPVRTLVGHTERSFTVAYSPDGELIASGGYDGTVRLWAADEGTEVAVLAAGPGLVTHVDFDASGSELVTVATGGGVKVWARTGSLRAEYHQPGVAVDAAFLPDGRIAVAADDPGYGLFVWASPDDGPGASLGHPLGACAAEVDPTGTYLASAGSEGIVRLWDTATLTETQVLEGHGGRACGLAFTPDGSRVISVSEDGTARVWATDTGTALLTLAGHTAGVEHVAASPDGRHVATGSSDGTTRIWDISPEGSRELLTVGEGTVATVAAAFDGDGVRLATTAQDGTATIWDAETGEALVELVGHTRALWEIEFSPDGTRVLTASQDTTARLWDAETGVQLHVLEGHADQVFAVAFAPDGATAFTGGFDGTVRAWDTTTGTELGRVDAGGRGVFGIDVSPDGAVLVASGERATLLDSVSGETIHEIPSDIGVITAVAFSPDGTRLVTGGADGTVRIWSLGDGAPQPIAELGGHGAVITAVAYDSAGDVLVTASPDGIVKVWSSDGTERFTIRGVDAPAVVAVDPAGRRVAIPGIDGTVRVYVLDPEELTALARTRLTRGFRDDECRRYLGGVPCPQP